MAEPLFQSFKHCPLCGGDLKRGESMHECTVCGHRMFHNPIAAVAVWIFDAEDRVLLIERGKPPAQGKLAPPGGFLDAGESLEDAAKREIFEEVGLPLADLRYLCSHRNDYVYREKSQVVCDAFFTARIASHAGKAKAQEGEVAAMRWLWLDEFQRDELAFESMRTAYDQLTR